MDVVTDRRVQEEAIFRGVEARGATVEARGEGNCGSTGATVEARGEYDLL